MSKRKCCFNEELKTEFPFLSSCDGDIQVPNMIDKCEFYYHLKLAFIKLNSNQKFQLSFLTCCYYNY